MKGKTTQWSHLSLTQSPTHTHTHTQHKTTGRREVGGGVNSKSVQLHQLIPVGIQEAFCRWITLMSVGLCWSTTWAAFPATPSAGRAQDQTACNYCIIALFYSSTKDSEQTFRGQPDPLQHDKVKHILNAPAQWYLHNDLIFCQLWRLCAVFSMASPEKRPILTSDIIKQRRCSFLF